MSAGCGREGTSPSMFMLNEISTYMAVREFPSLTAMAGFEAEVGRSEGTAQDLQDIAGCRSGGTSTCDLSSYCKRTCSPLWTCTLHNARCIVQLHDGKLNQSALAKLRARHSGLGQFTLALG